MSADVVTKGVTTVPSGVGGAVGVERRCWFVAIVKNNTEKMAHERLAKAGYESYLATQTLYRVWKNGRRAKIEHVVLPTLVFVRCSERERMQIVALPYINRFMTNKASGYSTAKPLAVIPDKQIETLRFMLGQSDVPVTISERSFQKGDRVRVARGKLCGLEGEVVTTDDGHSELIVRIDILGCAKVMIEAVDIELVDK
ncbi:UpxY family transcription antiterminator [Duncaniella muris]|jgi:transcription antitermination factor NusG|uniref:UpxY family transcription antiterminator n=1 Tax=Duncaniella muris TaxID=2094150 RepID=UPI000F476803|nr:UpxY family transcription antiterminator [Duncaniella muris]NBH93971.1 UpxY family transcription antiterminator [Muribaculaceae bacterium S4]NBI22212.1 UpxY family transcription antiterminator [Muribaculaceae bacterium Z1]ROS91858.1 UpxY family transcription antiterminator [Muribaculaceae bacterium Isolate-039 (Harlan)]ROT00097.1 UpxY family transcription antiterminator [Muribaculaceae bacterium Isolate-083 (Janvier)]ROT00530.1 UpxY family transcription antiterminator [Muribaculaceae bacter